MDGMRGAHRGSQAHVLLGGFVFLLASSFSRASNVSIKRIGGVKWLSCICCFLGVKVTAGELAGKPNLDITLQLSSGCSGPVRRQAGSDWPGIVKQMPGVIKIIAWTKINKKNSKVH